MPTTTLAPSKFREEAQRRLIDTFDLMLLLGLRSKQAVWNRVDTGKLPPPVVNKANIVALWDLDDLKDLIPDRKEG